jgi:metal-responsive CopG/Arc/MetJ family transcriptional regulator
MMTTTMNKKWMTSIKLQKNLHRKLQQRIIEEGYGIRGKSKWIIESIQSLFEFDDYATLVDIAKDMDHCDDIISIRFPEDLVMKIEKAIIHVRKQYPSIEGVKSNLIRASILQRLLRQPASVTEL